MTQEKIVNPVVEAENFDDVFNSNEEISVEQEQPEAKPENKPEVVVKPAEVDQGEEDAPPASEESWTKKAVIDERRKRQEAERKAQLFEAEIAELKSPKQKVERPDVFEDPEAAFQHSEKLFDNKLFEQRVNLTRDLMAEKHGDYEEVENHFLEMVAQDPSLSVKLRSAPNPAKFAYETAKTNLDLKSLKDPTYKEKLKEEIRKEILAEMVEKQHAKGAKPTTLPSLVNKTSTHSNVDPKEEYKGTLDEIF